MAFTPHAKVAVAIASLGIGFCGGHVVHGNQIINAENSSASELDQVSKEEESYFEIKGSEFKQGENGSIPIPPKELKLRSDKQKYNSRKNRFVAEGNALAVLDGYVLKADSIEFDYESQTLFAKGRVRLKRGSQYFQATSLRYNLDKEEGDLENIYGVIDIKNFIKSIKSINKKRDSNIDSDLILENQLLKERKSGSDFPEYAPLELQKVVSEKLTDQSIENFTLRDRLALRASIGGSKRSFNNLDTGSKLNALGSRKFIKGTISRWRVQADRLTFNKNGWEADRISFSNDPLTPAQNRIEAYDVVAYEDKNGDFLLESQRTRLIFEERIRVPFITKKRIKDDDGLENRWVFGFDNRDRDGFFIGNNLKPIDIGDKYNLMLQPQFLFQRAINGGTNSYIDSDKPIDSEKEYSPASVSDLFGIKSSINGEYMGWDVDLNADISSFDIGRWPYSNRYWFGMDKSLIVPKLNDIDLSIFGAYRYRAWNGSLGNTDIYSAYGSFLQKKGVRTLGGEVFNYLFRLGVGNYQAANKGTKSINGLWRGNFYGELRNNYKVWGGRKIDFLKEAKHRYTPSPIEPGLWISSKLETSYSVYGNGNNQNTIGLKLGPTLIVGNLNKRFLDYTKLSITGGATLKQGGSPFDFDEAVDLGTLGIGLSQQIAGPLVLNTEVEFNIDRGSKYYGKAINSKIEFRWERRSYDLAFYYNPYKGMGGFTIRLNDFDFVGNGIPYVSPK